MKRKLLVLLPAGVAVLVLAVFTRLFCPAAEIGGQASATQPAGREPAVRLGVEVLVEEMPELLAGKTVGLITNPTGVDSRLRPTHLLLEQLPGVTLGALFGPEHGFLGGVQGAVADGAEKRAGVPVYSLYGETRRLRPEMLAGLDALVFDMQDIGSRSYTYISTLRYLMEDAGRHGIPVIVLDRPNPVNGVTVDGPVLDPAFESFIGIAPIAYLHGMTVGEIALFYQREMGIACELTVVPMRNWRRDMSWRDTGLPWTPPSPHIPEEDTPWYYPVTGILGEASLVNVGVGYTMPFKLVGAPWIDAHQLARELNGRNLPGVYFQPFHYRPYYAKYANENCAGVRVIITDRERFRPVSAGYEVMAALRALYPVRFSFEAPDAVRRRDMFDKANGTDEVRKKLQAGVTVEEMTTGFGEKTAVFLEQRARCLLY